MEPIVSDAKTVMQSHCSAGLLVMIGAGNIGRGFIGQVFSQAGYEVVFVDVDADLVDALNREGRYPVHLVSREGVREEWMGPVRAIDGRDVDAVATAISEADLLATSVGASVLPRIVPMLSSGIERRFTSGNHAPLDILLCENLMDADHLLRGLLQKALPPEFRDVLESKVGLVETSIGRMVPVMTAGQKEEHPLLICAEPYSRLPVDAAAFKGPIPRIPSLEPVSPFRFYLERKLYLHNMGHCLTAYLGFMQGCTYIHEAIARPEVRLYVQLAMEDAALALAERHEQPVRPLLAHVEDLLYRFGNPALGDTVLRVGRDPIRKLAPDDRLTGCARMCLAQDMVPSWLLFGMAAAFRFMPEGDAQSDALQADLKQFGLMECLHRYTGLQMEDPAAIAVHGAYTLQAEEDALRKGISWCEAIRKAGLGAGHSRQSKA